MRSWLILSNRRRGLWIPWSVELSKEAEADILLAYKVAHERADAEISGLGRVVEKEGPAFLIPEVIIPEQTCSAGGTTFLADELERVLAELREEGKNPAQYNFWWHSHVEGIAWFSSIDDRMIENRLYAMLTGVHMDIRSKGMPIPDETMAGPFISLVGNVWGEMTARCDFLHRVEKEEKEEYRQYTFVIPVKRHLPLMSKEDREEYLASRLRAIKRAVREKVIFEDRPSGRLSDLRLPGLRQVDGTNLDDAQDGEGVLHDS